MSEPCQSPGVVDGLDRALTWLGDLPGAADDAERVDRIAALERLRGAVAAAQARETAEGRRHHLDPATRGAAAR